MSTYANTSDYESEGKAMQEEVPLSPVPPVKVLDRGRIQGTLFNEHIDVITKLMQFGIAFTTAGKNVLKVVTTLHDCFYKLRKNDSAIDLVLEMTTEIEDPMDVMSKIKNFDAIYKIQNTKTKIIFSIKFNGKDSNHFIIDAEKVPMVGDKTTGDETTILEPTAIKFSQKSLKNKCEEIFSKYIECSKADDVDKIGENIGFDI